MMSLKTRHQMTVAAAVALALAVPALALAQEELQEIRVTGSRIVQAPGMFTPTPVTSVQAEEIKTLSPANLIDSLNTLPVFAGNSTQQVALGGQNSGGSNLNLHGVGQSRTLVLLDGRRVVANGHVSKGQLVAAAQARGEVQLRETAILEPKIRLKVDRRSLHAARFAGGVNHRGRTPVADAQLEAVGVRRGGSEGRRLDALGHVRQRQPAVRCAALH